MKRTLVIVTYDADKWRLQMLVRSISLYLTKCRIHIIYNENKGFKEWQDWFTITCKKYIDNHKITFSQKRDYITEQAESHLQDLEKCGWTDQQVLKLAVSKNIKTRYYLCIDSKNFFTKTCSVDSIPQTAPSTLEWCEPILKNWIIMCYETFGMKFYGSKTKLTQNTTPYVIKTSTAKSLIEHFGGEKDFYKWFTSKAILPELSPAEFFLYEIYSQYINDHEPGTVNGNIIGFWSFQIEDLGFTLRDYKKLIIDNSRWQPDICMSSFHGSLNELLAIDDVKEILRYMDTSLDILPPGAPFNGLHRKPYFDK
jgi:hypothetical protein